MLKHIVKAQIRVTQSRERGDTAVEYGLMVAGLVLAIAVPVGLVGKGLTILFTRIATDPFMGWDH